MFDSLTLGHLFSVLETASQLCHAVLSALSFYDPRAIVSLSSCDLPSYGCDLLERLLGVLGQRETAELLTNDGTEVLEPLVDPRSARSEWTHTKSVVRADARLSNCSSTEDLVAGLHQYYSSDLFK